MSFSFDLEYFFGSTIPDEAPSADELFCSNGSFQDLPSSAALLPPPLTLTPSGVSPLTPSLSAATYASLSVDEPSLTGASFPSDSRCDDGGIDELTHASSEASNTCESSSSRKRKRAAADESDASSDSSSSSDEDFVPRRRGVTKKGAASKERPSRRYDSATRSESPYPAQNPHGRKDQVDDEYIEALLRMKPKDLSPEERVIRRRAKNRQSAAAARIRRIARAQKLEVTSVVALRESQTLAEQIAAARRETEALVRTLNSLGYVWDSTRLQAVTLGGDNDDDDDDDNGDAYVRPRKQARLH